jgi:hypothetical protein
MRQRLGWPWAPTLVGVVALAPSEHSHHPSLKSRLTMAIGRWTWSVNGRLGPRIKRQLLLLLSRAMVGIEEAHHPASSTALSDTFQSIINRPSIFYSHSLESGSAAGRVELSFQERDQD